MSARRTMLLATFLIPISVGTVRAQAPAPTVKVVQIKEEAPGLLARAKVTPEAASATALAQYAGSRIVEAEIEEEDGQFIYSFDLKVPGRWRAREVHVDAMTGQVRRK